MQRGNEKRLGPLLDRSADAEPEPEPERVAVGNTAEHDPND